MRENTSQRCPRCGAMKRLKIIYGLPGSDLIRDSEHGKVALGGCLVDPSNPRWKCAVCGETWGRMGPRSNGQRCNPPQRKPGLTRGNIAFHTQPHGHASMRDIKLTLAKDPSRAPSIEKERDRLKKEGPLWYPLHAGKPKDADRGSWVYFIQGGKLVGRARAQEIKKLDGTPLYSYSGEPQSSTAWNVMITDIERAVDQLSHKGFQGFNYVTAQEKERFEKAFAPQARRMARETGR